MCLIPTLLHHPLRQNHWLLLLYLHHPSPTSCWLASNAAWQCRWLRGATLTRSTVHLNALPSFDLMLDSIPPRPMGPVCPQTNTLTLVDLMAMPGRMGLRIPNTVPKPGSIHLVNTGD